MKPFQKALAVAKSEMTPWKIEFKWVWALLGATIVRSWQKRRRKRVLKLRSITSDNVKLETLTGNPARTLDEFLESSRKKTLDGSWKKDAKRSESLHPSLELFQTPWLVRKGVPFANGLQITKTDSHFSTLVSASIIKLKESYPLDGSTVECRRRDMRSGKHLGRVQLLQIHGEEAVVLECSWPAPAPGICRETFRLEPGSNGNVLLVDTHLLRTDTNQHVEYTLVYVRA